MDVKNNKMNALVAGVVALTAVSGANAATIMSRLPELIGTVQGITILIYLAGILIGFGLLVAAGIHFKKYADDNRSTSPVKGFIYAAAGVFLISLGVSNDTLRATIFGEDASNDGDFDFSRTDRDDFTG